MDSKLGNQVVGMGRRSILITGLKRYERRVIEINKWVRVRVRVRVRIRVIERNGGLPLQ